MMDSDPIAVFVLVVFFVCGGVVLAALVDTWRELARKRRLRRTVEQRRRGEW
jgi:hypothetical protein